MFRLGFEFETNRTSSHADSSFNNWRLAFTVNLKLVDAHEETITEAILKMLGRQSKSSFKQLILDLSREFPTLVEVVRA